MNGFRSKAILTLLAVILCMPSTVFASSGKTEVENHGSIGAVDIKLNYEVEGNVDALLPGETINLKSSITNQAEPAWIRVKIQYPVYKNEKVLEHLAEKNLTELDDSLITFADSEWLKIGSYYYWKTPVGMGKTVPFTEAIKFPADWDNRLVSSQFGIHLTAEAVQRQNFEPDFDSDDPWHGVVIESYDTTDYIHKGEGNARFSIRYEGGAEGMVRAGDDFFSNWETLLPGDVPNGSLTVTNNMKIPVKMFFSTRSVLGDTVKDEYLLSSLHIRIWHNGTSIYDGDLMDPLQEILLKEYAPGETGTVEYELYVPASLTNEQAEMDFTMVWTFRALEVPPAIREVILTGELSRVLLIAGLAIITFSAGLLMKKRKGGRTV